MPIHRSIGFLLLSTSLLRGEEELSFNADIRPLLSDRCFVCHGFDSSSREAELRLDVPEAAFEDREDGPAIVPGDPAASLIWQRIISKDSEEVMPPADHLLRLNDWEKEQIRTWIEQGANYEKHWTFTRVERPEVAKDGHPIDSLVLRRLKKEGLQFSKEAERRILIRRLSLDLRGLPPTPEEVQAFLADEAPEAWKALVDRFLADPAFGERMAWPWLDAARYADTNGYQGDKERTMWPWRDWVVEAINRNLPYDDFTVWQVAGDLIPEASFEQQLATGFLRNHAINGEGGRIPEENRVDYVMDMSETVGTVWMGLTMNCCRCHDHKYDPLTQKEYYGLYDFFNQTPVNGGGGNPQTPPVLATPSISEKTESKMRMASVASLERQVSEHAATITGSQHDWEATQQTQGVEVTWQTLKPETVWHPKMDFELLEDHSALLVGEALDRGDYRVTLRPEAGRISALRLEAMRHPSMTHGGIGPSDSGNFVLTDFEATLIGPSGKRTELSFSKATASYEQGALKARNTLDHDPTSGWAVWQGKPITRDHEAIFHLSQELNIQAGSTLEVQLRHQSKHPLHLLGRFRLSTTKTAPTEAIDPTLSAAIRTPHAKRTEAQAQQIRDAHLASDTTYRKLQTQLSEERIGLQQLQQRIPKVMIMADRPERRKSYILAIGSYEQPGEEVTAHTPDALPVIEMRGEHGDRLDLARWLVSREHPLTSRVTVNHVWQEFFGTGLVKTPEDFGVQSEAPAHPELLDWLAADFMESGWDFKALVRHIVSSRVYKQSSRVTPELLERDPQNRLLARGPRFRMPAWMIRDQAIAVSGLLVRRIGGEPVKPWQPEGLWAEVTFGGGKKHYKPDTGEKLRRRSLYTFWRRISAPPMFFDNAKRETCEVGATRTNSPLHALSTLNDRLYAEAARALASRAAKRASDGPPTSVGTSHSGPLAEAFELVLMRPPSDAESSVLVHIYDKARRSFQSDPTAADDFLSLGETPEDPEIDPITHAALATVCLSILNTDEALTKE